MSAPASEVCETCVLGLQTADSWQERPADLGLEKDAWLVTTRSVTGDHHVFIIRQEIFSLSEVLLLNELDPSTCRRCNSITEFQLLSDIVDTWKDLTHSAVPVTIGLTHVFGATVHLRINNYLEFKASLLIFEANCYKRYYQGITQFQEFIFI